MLILSSLLADRFSRIIVLLLDIVAEQGMRQQREARFTLLVHTYLRLLGKRFLDRATTPPGRRENLTRGPRPPAATSAATSAPGTPAAPRVRPVVPEGPPEGPPVGPPEGPPPKWPLAERKLPRGQAWLRALLQPVADSRAQLVALLHEPEFAALLLARPALARILRPLCKALSVPPMPCMAAPPRRRPDPAPANAEAAIDPATDLPAEPTANPTPKPHRPKFRFSRREDLLFRLRMGKPIFEV